MSDMAKLKVVSDGLWTGTYVTVDGKPVECTEITFRVAVDDVVTATVTFVDPEADVTFIGQLLEADDEPLPTLDPAEIVAALRQYERTTGRRLLAER